MTAAILDVDGTLVDTNYHHTLAWGRAFYEQEVTPPLWRIHRHIGMGGDKLVAAVAGDDFERRSGDDVRDAEKRIYGELIGEVRPLEGARELIVELRERGHRVVLASSAKEDEVEHYIDLLDARELAHEWTTSDDVEATKPDPDLVGAALEKAGALSAVMIGDTTWDVEAAARAELKTLGLLTGGFSSAELRDAGAVAIFSSPRALCEGLDSTPLR
jgi:phosphoglycolate phosphatase-like HAD superfamily hydrolase